MKNLEHIQRPEKQNLSDKNILKDVEWIELTKKAKVNWEKLKNEIKDKSELDYMSKLEKSIYKLNGAQQPPNEIAAFS